MQCRSPQKTEGHAIPDSSFMVKPLKLIPFLLTAVPAYGRDIQHTISELNEGPSLDWNI